MKLILNGESILFKNGENSFVFYRTHGNYDLAFESENPNITATFDSKSENKIECKVYELLMKLWKDILSNDNSMAFNLFEIKEKDYNISF